MRLRIITPVIFYFFILAIVLFSGCEGCGCQKQEQLPVAQGGSSQPSVEGSITPPPPIAFKQIPLNDPSGIISLTRNFYFIFDSSGSMNDQYAGQRKIDGAKSAVAKFMAKIPLNVNLGLYVYDGDGGREVLPLGPRNNVKFLQQINKLEPGNGTPLGAAIRFGADKLVQQYKKQLGYGEFRLIVVSDGIATDVDEFPKALEYATGYRIPIYAIGLDIEGENPIRSYALSYREASNYDDLARALEKTMAESEVFELTDFTE